MLNLFTRCSLSLGTRLVKVIGREDDVVGWEIAVKMLVIYCLVCLGPAPLI